MKKILILLLIGFLVSCDNSEESSRKDGLTNKTTSKQRVGLTKKNTPKQKVDKTVEKPSIEEPSYNFVGGKYKMVLIYEGEYQRTWVGSYDMSNLEYVALYNEDDGNVTIMSEPEYMLVREVDNGKFDMLWLDNGNIRRKWFGTYDLTKLDYPILHDEKSNSSTVVSGQAVLIISKL